jgi:hypothetical protein
MASKSKDVNNDHTKPETDKKLSNEIVSPLDSKEKKEEPPKKFDFNKLIDLLFISLSNDAPPTSKKDLNKIICEYICERIDRHPIGKAYNILILHDSGQMVKNDADNIYSAAVSFGNTLPLMLVLYSGGGVVGSAYLIGKLCREYSNGKFIVVVPRQAKSAATLLCCAADEIHMGSMSELGPIDPQIGDYPALGLKSSVEHIAALVKEYPDAADMFAKYLNMSVQPIHLGYYERVAESAVQYAERLLRSHVSTLKQKPANIAKNLVYSYKDHGFVIDKEEAIEIFGDNVIKINSDEYKLGNDLYTALMSRGSFKTHT